MFQVLKVEFAQRIRNKARQQDDPSPPPRVAHILDILLTLYYLNIFLKYQNTRSAKPNPDPGQLKDFGTNPGKEIIPKRPDQPNHPGYQETTLFPN